MKRDIFVSSTFKDFQVEREIMLKDIEAEINDELLKKNLGVNFIDLRWGIDTSKGGLEKVITFCIDYVNQTKPFLIVLLGDSYGSCVSKELLEPIYNANKLIYDGKEKSVTEVEIESSMIFDGDNSNKIILNRTIKNLDKSHSSIYYDKENEDKLLRLKEKIFSTVSQDKIYNYSATLEEGQIHIDNIISFKEFIKKKVIDLILTNYKESKNKYEYIIKDLEEKFVGRNEIYQIKEKICSISETNKRFFVIQGKPGIGKTCVASKLKSLLEKDGHVVGMHLCNEEKENVDFTSIIISLLKETDNYLELDVIKNLQKIDKNKQYYFIIDSSDRILDSDQFVKMTSKFIIPSNVHFIMLVNESSIYKYDYVLEELSEEDVLLVIQKELELNKKNVPPVFLYYLKENMDKFQHLRNPSLLSLFINELCHLRKEEYEALGRQKDFMSALTALFFYKADSFPKNIYQYLDTLDEEATLVLQLLSLSRDGLDEEDIKSISSLLGSPIDIYTFRSVVFEFRKMIKKVNSDKYIVSNTLLRNAILGSLTKEEVKQTIYFMAAGIGSRGSNFNLSSFKEMLYQFLMLKDYEGMGTILSLAYQNLVEEEKYNLGRYFQVLSNQYYVNEPNDIYLNIAKLKIGMSNFFLYDYSLFDMSELYVENSLELFESLYQNRDKFNDQYHANVSYYYMVSLIAHQRFQEAINVYQESIRKYLNLGICIQALRPVAYTFDPQIGSYLSGIYKGFENEDELPLNLVDAYRIIELLILLEGNILKVDKDVLDNLFELVHKLLVKADKESHLYYQVMYMLKYMKTVCGNSVEYKYSDLDEFLAKNPDFIKVGTCAQSYKFMIINMFGERVEKLDDESGTQIAEYFKYVLDNKVDMSLNDYLLTFKIFHRLILCDNVIDDEYILKGYEYYSKAFYKYFDESLKNKMVLVKLLTATLSGLFFNMDVDEEGFIVYEQMLNSINDKLKANSKPYYHQDFMIREFQYILDDLQDFEELDKLEEYLEKFIHEKIVN